MINESMLLRKLKRKISSHIFESLSTDWIMEILQDETLMVMSTYYPYIVRGIVIRECDAIISKHPQTGHIAKYKYRIPTETPDIPFIGIEAYYFPGNGLMDRYTGIAPSPVDAMMGKLRSTMPVPEIRYSVMFEPPNVAFIDPIPRIHRDFTLDMERVRRLHEFPLTFFEYLTNLFVCDVKIAIYDEYKNARDSSVLGGVEVQTYISDFSDAKSERETLLEKFDADYYKNPERFRSFVSYA